MRFIWVFHFETLSGSWLALESRWRMTPMKSICLTVLVLLAFTQGCSSPRSYNATAESSSSGDGSYPNRQPIGQNGGGPQLVTVEQLGYQAQPNSLCAAVYAVLINPINNTC